MTLRLTAFAALASIAITAPVAAADLNTQNQTCLEALEASLSNVAETTSIRFDKRRGAGKKQRLTYSVTAGETRGKATCIVLRGEIREIRFDDDMAIKMAAAE